MRRVLYENRDTLLPRLALAAAAAQLPLWLNLGDWSLRSLQEEVPEPKTNASNTATSTPTDSNTHKPTYTLAPLSTRIAASTLCLFTGFMFAYGAHTYTSRLVRTVSLDSAGSKSRTVTVETHSLFNRLAKRSDLVSNFTAVSRAAAPPQADGMSNGSRTVVLRHADSKTNYLLLRSGEFKDPNLFDSLFHSPVFRN
ncbi:hypothetical protein HDU81_004462 [Chytriomyces hyalinus]|nr:hypothetical protein HDU81_004462 [Chytriomyces hyalinus]